MQASSRERARKVDAAVPVGIGHVQLVRNFWNEPIDTFGTASEHRLELALLPRSRVARGCFPDDWGPDRFEPIGEMFFLPADHLLHAQSDCQQQSSIVCSFDPDAVSTWFGELQWTDFRLQGSLDIASSSIRGLLFRLREEIRSPGFASGTIIELLVAQIAIELSRYLTGIEAERPRGGLSTWRLKLIDERLCDHEAPPSLTELAELCNLSVRHLTRAFRVTRGRSIGNYIAEHRVDRAKRLLATGMAIKSVAYATGFTAPSNFAATFLRATGETPRQYKQRVHHTIGVAKVH
jgi:AraC family transcriptional regulator